MPITNSLKTYAVQIGQSATDTQNFQLSANNDGTGKLARKSDGTGGDILSWDAAGKVTLATIPVITAAQSIVRVNTLNGYGSSSTKIRRFATVVTYQGSDITYVDSATLGATFTINTSGLYAMNYQETLAASNPVFAITVNASSLVNSPTTLALSEVAALMQPGASGAYSNIAAVLYLTAGSVVRGQTDGNAAGSSLGFFNITRVS